MASTILLIEDDAVSLKQMRDVLDAHGFTTEAATDGVTGLAMAQSGTADLVIMDIGLPGIDGVTATGRLREDPSTKGLPVVAVTAYAMPEDERRMREAGCNAFLTKPLRLQELVAVVKGLLDSDGGR